jgi:hypothetical protein
MIKNFFTKNDSELTDRIEELEHTVKRLQDIIDGIVGDNTLTAIVVNNGVAQLTDLEKYATKAMLESQNSELVLKVSQMDKKMKIMSKRIKSIRTSNSMDDIERAAGLISDAIIDEHNLVQRWMAEKERKSKTHK